jgi:hypothetical protein
MFRPILTNKFVMSAIVIGIAFVAFARFQLSYPAQWDGITLGMSREEVYSLVGNPSQSTGDIKGDFWWQDKLTQQHELHTFFEDEKVISMYILRRIGTKHHFREAIVRSDFIEPIPTVLHCQLRRNWEHFNGKTVRLETGIYWFQHGYYFFDEACSDSRSVDPSLINEGRTAVWFDEEQRELIWNQLQSFPHDRLSAPIARIEVIGRFTRRLPGLNRTDGITSRTSFHFEIDRITKTDPIDEPASR